MKKVELQEVEVLSGPSRGAAAWYKFADDIEAAVAGEYARLIRGDPEIRRFNRGGYYYTVFVLYSLMDRPVAGLWLNYAIWDQIPLQVRPVDQQETISTFQVSVDVSMRLHAADFYNMILEGAPVVYEINQLAQIGFDLDQQIKSAKILLDPSKHKTAVENPAGEMGAWLADEVNKHEL